MLETMERNAERMQHLIGEILDLARYRSGTIGLQLRQFDARELAESAAATIRPLAEQRRQTVDLSVPDGGGPRVYGDRPRLDRALLNLVANAQRFAPDEGHVTLRLEKADGDLVLVDGVKVCRGMDWALALPDPAEPVTHLWAESASAAGARALSKDYARRIRRLVR